LTSSLKVAEKSRLCFFCRHDREHLLDVVDEAHVEHAIGLVEDEDLDVREVERALAVVVEEAPRRGDEDVDAAAQLVDLRLHADAAEHDHAGQLRVLAVDANAFLDLRGELARRRQDEGADRQLAARIAHGGPGHEAMQERQDEAGGLAGAGLGAAHDVAAREDGGDRLGLDGSRGGVARFVHGTQQRLGEAESIERHGKFCLFIGLLLAVERAPVEGRRGRESEATASTLTGKLGDASPHCKASGAATCHIASGPRIASRLAKGGK
jgi:hypothetical protein